MVACEPPNRAGAMVVTTNPTSAMAMIWPRRPSDSAVLLLALAAMACLATGLHLVWHRPTSQATTARSQALAETLQLTDLSLFTEARYIRHLSMADRFSAFQDHPLSLEHFPSGSLIGPPTPLRQGAAAIQAAPSPAKGGAQ